MQGGALHLADFFPGQAAAPELSALLRATAPLALQPRNVLLSGPDRSGKTTLLFHLAYSLAAKGGSVVVLGSRDRLEAAPPALGPGRPASDPGWSRVHLKYVEDDLALLKYLSLLHLAPQPPNVILIDDFERLLPAGDGGHRSRDAQLCRLLAVAADSLVRLHYII